MPTEKSVTYKLFTFDELSAKAKERARDWFRKTEDEMFDAEDFKELALVEPAAYLHRVKTDVCNFALNYCQGDGVAFYGAFDLDYFTAAPDKDDAPPDGGPLATQRAKLVALVRELEAAGYSLAVRVERAGWGGLRPLQHDAG